VSESAGKSQEGWSSGIPPFDSAHGGLLRTECGRIVTDPAVTMSAPATLLLRGESPILTKNLESGIPILLALRLDS
jgi:hypothetical protein